MFGRTAVTSLDGSASTSPLLLAIANDGGMDASTEADHAADTTDVAHAFWRRGQRSDDSGIGPVAHPVGNELRIFLEVIPKERSEAVETFPRHRNREDPRAREELAELPCGLNALRDRKALMAGNFADRNSKIYRLERPFFALMQRLDVAGLPPHRGLSQ